MFSPWKGIRSLFIFSIFHRPLQGVYKDTTYYSLVTTVKVRVIG